MLYIKLSKNNNIYFTSRINSLKVAFIYLKEVNIIVVAKYVDCWQVSRRLRVGCAQTARRLRVKKIRHRLVGRVAKCP